MLKPSVKLGIDKQTPPDLEDMKILKKKWPPSLAKLYDMDVNGRFDCHNSPQMLLENLPGLP